MSADHAPAQNPRRQSSSLSYLTRRHLLQKKKFPSRLRQSVLLQLLPESPAQLVGWLVDDPGSSITHLFVYHSSSPQRLDHIRPAPEEPLVPMSSTPSHRARLPLARLLLLGPGARCGSRG